MKEDVRKIPRQPTEHELTTMIDRMNNGDSIAIFNARKSCYVYIEDQYLVDIIKENLKKKLEELK